MTYAGIHEGVEFEEFFTQVRARVVNGYLLLPQVAQGAQVWIAGNIRLRGNPVRSMTSAKNWLIMLLILIQFRFT